MKKISILLLTVIVGLVLSACGTQSEGEISSGQSLDNNSGSVLNELSEMTAFTFVDALNREVRVTSHERVVVLLGSFCEEWVLAGGNVVGTVSDTFKNYDLGLTKDVVDVGTHMEPDIEKIIALEPDLIIASSMQDAQVEALDVFEKAGITTAYFYVNNFDDYLESFRAFTNITGQEELYVKYGQNVAAEIDEAKAKIDGRKPTILFIRAAASSVKVKGSTGTVGGEILADLDTENIADSDKSMEDLSIEAIIVADPEYIFVTTQGSDTEAALKNVEELLKNNPAWESLRAVKNSNYYVIDKSLYNSKPNARWGEAYRRLADIIY